MATVRETVVLNATPDEVWPYIAEPENVSQWRKDITRFEMIDEGQPQVGQRFSIEKEIGGKKRRFDSRVTVLEVGRRFAFEAEAADFARVKAAYEVVLEGDGCRFIIDETVEMLHGGFLMRIIDRLIIQRGLSKTIKGFLADLREVIEGKKGQMYAP
jgi:uncharacterized membrane protein